MSFLRLIPALFLVFNFLPLAKVQAQWVDNFSDGNFTNNPTWTGNENSFIVENQILRSKDSTANNTFYLSTASSLAMQASWECWVNLRFATSGSNYADFWLTSNNANLRDATEGYFVRIGDTPDEISLHRKSGSTSSKIIDGRDGVVRSSTNNVFRIRATRSSSGDWLLFRDSTGTGNSYVLEGSVNDMTYTTSTHGGVLIRQSTASFFSKHYFDDFKVEAIVPDIIPPTATTANALAANRLEILFSEPVTEVTANQLSNYVVNNGIGNPSSVDFSPASPARAELTFASNFVSAQPYTVTVNNISDLAGNVMQVASVLNFNFVAPEVAGFREILINEFMADETPKVGQPLCEWLELYNPTNKTFQLGGFTIWDATATSGAAISNYSLGPGEHVLLARAANLDSFPSVNNKVACTIPSLNNAGDDIILRRPDGFTIDRLSYADTWYKDAVKRNGGWTLELINPVSPCPSGIDNWIASTDPSGGTPGRQNSVYSTEPDLNPPTVASYNLLTNSTIKVMFSKFMDSVSLRLLANYSITGRTITNVSTTFPFNQLTLTLDATLQVGTINMLTISNLRDCSGNNLSVTNISIGIGATPATGDLVINELYPDESPSNGLPGFEFIEVHNKSNRLLSLNGWSVQDPGARGFFPDGTVIYPDSFLIVTPTNGLAPYAAYGPTITLSRWPSLNNDRDTISLINPSGASVQTLVYELSWYQDNAKANGGWTLEQINPTTTCPPGPANWIASVAAIGGTPGKRNSVYSTAPDATRPEFVSLRIVSPTAMQLTFSKGMDSLSLATISNYTVPGLTIISAIPFNFLQSVTLNFSSPLDSGRAYNIVLTTNLRDCSGNRLSFTTLPFGIGASPQPGQLVINELYPDESPSNGLPGFEFIEIHNKSNRLLSLDGWSIQDPTSRGFFPFGTVIRPDSFLIVAPTNGVAPYSVYGPITTLSRWPSLNNDRDTISLINPSGVSVQTLVYELSWYQDNAKANGGWTLEQINPTTTCPPGPANWIASVAAIGGTPGKRNSVFSTAPDITRPAFVSFRFVSSTSMQLTFSKGMDSLSLATIANYTVTGLTIISAIPFNFFQSVTLNFSSPLDSGRAYNITLTDLRDCSGNRLPFTILPFGIGASPQPGQLVINELYPDESPSNGLPAYEFAELFNASDKILDLSGCTFSSRTSRGRIPDNTSMAPGEYLILAGSSAASSYQSLGKTVAVVSMPTLNNTNMEVFLRNKSNTLLHKVNYNLSWYRDVTKQDGGWSLELIDPLYYCTGSLNWTASEAEIGGTPGVRNSVAASNPDLTPPSMLKAAFLDSVTVILYLSEDLDSLQAMNSATYAVSPNMEVTGMSFPTGRFDRVYLRLSAPGLFKTIYTVTARNLQDCSGNVQTVDQEATFERAYSPEPGDIVINELLSDPLVGGVDFVEVYNTTNKSIDLAGCKLANARGTIRVISEEPYVLKPNEYVLLTPDAGLTLRDYPKSKTENFVVVPTFPAYNIDSGTVRILSATDVTLDRFFFSQRMHFRLIDNTKGISLERISPALPTNNPDNWKSASSNVGYATPGFLNSQGFGFERGTDELEVTPQVFSPDEDGDRDFAFIDINVAEPGFVANLWIFDSRGRIVKTVLQNELLGVKNSIRWDGLRDDNTKAPIGAYMVMAELYSLDGKKRVIKKPVAIASYFR